MVGGEPAPGRTTAGAQDVDQGPPVRVVAHLEHDPDVLRRLRSEVRGLRRTGTGTVVDSGEARAVIRDLDLIGTGIVLVEAAGVQLDLIKALRRAHVHLPVHAEGLVSVGAEAGTRVTADRVLRGIARRRVRVRRRGPASLCQRRASHIAPDIARTAGVDGDAPRVHGHRCDRDGVDLRHARRAREELDGDVCAGAGGLVEVLFHADVGTVTAGVARGLDDVEVLQRGGAVDVD